jgi:hypothetical protein
MIDVSYPNEARPDPIMMEITPAQCSYAGKEMYKPRTHNRCFSAVVCITSCYVEKRVLTIEQRNVREE